MSSLDELNSALVRAKVIFVFAVLAPDLYTVVQIDKSAAFAMQHKYGEHSGQVLEVRNLGDEKILIGPGTALMEAYCSEVI